MQRCCCNAAADRSQKHRLQKAKARSVAGFSGVDKGVVYGFTCWQASFLFAELVRDQLALEVAEDSA